MVGAEGVVISNIFSETVISDDKVPWIYSPLLYASPVEFPTNVILFDDIFKPPALIASTAYPS